MYHSFFPSRSASLLDLFDRNFDFLNHYDSRLDSGKYSTESTDEEYRISISLPGHSKETVKLSVENGKLLITANSPEESKNSLCRGESFRFSLPKNCNPDEIDASISNGILSVNIAKITEKKASKRIEVSVN
jgi:HSP20 family molecular chaperone IbpA